jgi:hypothetical protein
MCWRLEKTVQCTVFDITCVVRLGHSPYVPIHPDVTCLCSMSVGFFLTKAVLTGRLDEVQRMLMSGEASVADTDPEGFTALQMAARVGDLDVVQWLLEHGRANIGERDSDEMTSLLVAADRGHLIVVQWLIQHGWADVGERKNSDAMWTCLLFAADNGSLNMVQWLVQHGRADIGERDVGGQTALLLAAGSGRLNVVKWLLEHGASITERSNSGNNAFLRAAANNQFEVVQWLMRFGGYNITDVNNRGKSVWDHMRYRFNYRFGCSFALLKIIVARGVPPRRFLKDLPPALQPLVTQGGVILQRMPAESAWRAQRTAELHASDCGHSLAESLVEVIGGYAEVSEEELWEVLEQEQAKEPTSTRGMKRKSSGKDDSFT